MSDMEIDEMKGRLNKPEKDYSEATTKELESASHILSQQQPDAASRLKEVVDSLLSLEKQTRMASDAENTTRLVVAIVRHCGTLGAWEQLNENIVLIAKKRTQFKQTITRMVQEAASFVEQVPSKDAKIELINTLRQVADGKIYVEVERARLTRALAQLREEEGNIKEAADLLQDVQIETIGTMEAREKIDFILDSMRLVLEKNDHVRAYLISKKITSRSLQDKDHQDLKVRYFMLMIRYYLHEKNYLEISKCYHHIFETAKIQEDPNLWVDNLQNIVLYVVLSPFDNHQSDLLNRIWNEKKIEEKPLQMFRGLLKKFVGTELILWPEFEASFAAPLSRHKVFVDDKTRWEDLHHRVVEHNIRVVSKYFSRITMKRLSQLLYLNEAKTEEFLSKMVSSKTISAKIDRIDGIVNFKKPQQTQDVLNNWSSDIVQLLGLLEKSVHLINGQYMQANAKV